MNLRRPTTTTAAQPLIGMVQYYKNMWPRRSHLLDPLTEAESGSKGRKIIWNNVLEDPFKELKRVVSSETLLGYPD